MSSKQPLSITNLEDGQTVEDINAAIALAADGLIDAARKKAKAEVTIKLTLETADDDADFITVTPVVTVKAPTPAKRTSLYPVQRIGGKRQLVVDPAQVGDQMVIPGVADLEAKRAAS